MKCQWAGSNHLALGFFILGRVAMCDLDVPQRSARASQKAI